MSGLRPLVLCAIALHLGLPYSFSLPGSRRAPESLFGRIRSNAKGIVGSSGDAHRDSIVRARWSRTDCHLTSVRITHEDPP